MPWKPVALLAAGLLLALPFNGLYAAAYTFQTGHPPALERSVHIIQAMMRSHPVLTVAFASLIGPMAEETLFRGLLFGSLEKRLGLWTIPVTAVVFGAFHLDLVYFIPLTVIGILLGWARWKSGSIWLPVMLHVLINGLALSVLWHKLKAGP